jgi:uncharacterized membrane protein
VKRTRATAVIALALLGFVLGLLGEVAAAASGRAIIVPPVTLPLTLIVVSAVVVMLAWPIRQVTRGRGRRLVDPFRAMRIAVLAKASSLSGALLLGAGLGIVAFILTRSVVPAVTSSWLAIAMTLGAGILLAGGLMAENFCTLPPDDDEVQPGGERV